MDRARRATPVSSPFTFLRDRRREQELHVRRLAHTRPSVDNSRPASLDLPHLARNAKGDAMRKERLARIEGENRVLLERLGSVLKRPAPNVPRGAPVPQRSLNEAVRRRELERITADNRALSRRIRAVEAAHPVQALEADYARHCSLVRRHSACGGGGAPSVHAGADLPLPPAARSRGARPRPAQRPTSRHSDRPRRRFSGPPPQRPRTAAGAKSAKGVEAGRRAPAASAGPPPGASVVVFEGELELPVVHAGGQVAGAEAWEVALVDVAWPGGARGGDATASLQVHGRPCSGGWERVLALPPAWLPLPPGRGRAAGRLYRRVGAPGDGGRGAQAFAQRVLAAVEVSGDAERELCLRAGDGGLRAGDRARSPLPHRSRLRPGRGGEAAERGHRDGGAQAFAQRGLGAVGVSGDAGDRARSPLPRRSRLRPGAGR